MTTPEPEPFIIHLSPGQSDTDGSFPIFCGNRFLTEVVTTSPETYNCPACRQVWEGLPATPAPPPRSLAQDLPEKFNPAGDPLEIAKAVQMAVLWLKNNPDEYQGGLPDTWYSTTVNGNGYAIQMESSITVWVYRESPTHIYTEEVLATATIDLEDDGPYLDENAIELRVNYKPTPSRWNPPEPYPATAARSAE